MLSSGMLQREVAEALGVTPRTIQRWQLSQEFSQTLDAAQSAQTASQATTQAATQVVMGTLSRRDELRAKEVTLLDKLQDKLMDSIESDGCGYRVVNLLIKISERRSKLLGLEIRNLSTLDAVEKLLQEDILSVGQASVVFHGVESIERNLKIIETQKGLTGEIEAVKNLTAEELAQQYRSFIDGS